MYVTTQIQVTPFTTKPVTIFVHSIFHIENVSYTKQTRKKEKKKKENRSENCNHCAGR